MLSLAVVRETLLKRGFKHGLFRLQKHFNWGYIVLQVNGRFIDFNGCEDRPTIELKIEVILDDPHTEAVTVCAPKSEKALMYAIRRTVKKADTALKRLNFKASAVRQELNDLDLERK